jgi:hypothetical protein
MMDIERIKSYFPMCKSKIITSTCEARASVQAYDLGLRKKMSKVIWEIEKKLS